MKYRLLLSFGLWTAMAGVGWAQWLDFDLRRNIPWRIGDAPSAKTPTKIVAIWTDAVLHQPGKPPTRGFGGRLMFYGPDENTPLKVDGTLIVYGFDEEGRAPTDVKPDRKYVFPPDQFARHYSKSKLGHSYSVWVPWDEVGGPRKEISLIARFIPKNGAAIVSGQSRQILPGVPPAEDPASGSGQPKGVPATQPSTAGNQSAPAAGWLQGPGQFPSMPVGLVSSPGGQMGRLGPDTMGRTTRMWSGSPGGPINPPSPVVPEAPLIPPEKGGLQPFAPEQLVPPGGNPLRPTGYYETPSAGQVQPARAEAFAAVQTPAVSGHVPQATGRTASATGRTATASGQPSSPTSRMRTATIPIPAPLVRPSNPSARNWEAGSASYEAGAYGSAVGPHPIPSPTNPGLAPNPYTASAPMETVSPWQPAGTTLSPRGGGPPFGGGQPVGGVPSYGISRSPSVATTGRIPAGAATGSEQAQSQTNRWTPGQPGVRSGPLGPQAPAGPIGPQARDRAALPPLP